MQPIKSVLIDDRTPQAVIEKIKGELAVCNLYGLDCETQDERRHTGLNIYNNKTRHVFDHRRTVMTGFSIYVDGSDTAYYINLAHKDRENRLPNSIVHELLDAVNPEAIVVAHNAPFELVMFLQCHARQLQNVVCTLQMAVSHHGPDEYWLDVFDAAPLPMAFYGVAKEALVAFADYHQGDTLNGYQQEVLGKFIAKESKAAHSYNGFWRSIKIGYDLKTLTKSRFGYEQMSYEKLLAMHGAEHMGDLTGEQTVAYGADDAYWAVQHYKWMLADMLKNNPKALRAFFQTENPMVQLYAEAWLKGIRLDLEQVFKRRDAERHEMAETLRRFKANLRKALPFPAGPHPKMMEKEDWYKKGWKNKRAQIERWVNMPDSDDDFTQAFQVSNPIGNAWAAEKGIAVPKSGKLNLVYWHGMRTIMYDLLRVPLQYDHGSVASDGDARGRIREKITDPLHELIMKDLQEMAEIEQRMKLYLTPYTQLMDPETSRVYPSLSSQLATRRLATSFPNPMQLAKRGASAYIRSFYLGDTDNHVVISADWSALELVLIGDMSGGRGFRKIFGQVPYGDMHSGSAVDGLSIKWMPGLTEEEFHEFKFGRNPNGRRLVDFSGVELSPKDFYTWARGTAIGKGINFGYWYSGAVSLVADNLGLTSEEHWALVDRYRARFPDEEAWRIGVQDEAAIFGFVELPDGHRRNRHEVTLDWARSMRSKFSAVSASPIMDKFAQLAIKRIQSRGRNQVVNAKIQGTNATLTKRSFLAVRKAVEDFGMKWGEDARLMMPIHDELVWSVDRRVALDFIPLLRTSMETHPEIVKTLPLNCTVAMGRTFRPFDKTNPAMSQIELDEAQAIEGIIPKDLEKTKLSDDKVAELLDWMFT